MTHPSFAVGHLVPKNGQRQWQRREELELSGLRKPMAAYEIQS
jgi:hypothetical protein